VHTLHKITSFKKTTGKTKAQSLFQGINLSPVGGMVGGIAENYFYDWKKWFCPKITC
jgi:hypothetical protein